MDKENLIELTNKLYKLTLLFPKKEPLRYKMREVADEVLANFIKGSNPGKLKDLEVLKSYFEIAKWQNWISYFDVLEIEEEYDRINPVRDSEDRDKPKKQHISNGVNLVRDSGDREEAKVARGRASTQLDSRKEKILEILKEKEKIQVGELKKLLPNVSKRTLRRDFDQLLKLELVERIGERNDTFYCLKAV